jgi:hypothetical protein
MEEQVSAHTLTLNGEDTCVPLTGLEIVVPANTGIVEAISMIHAAETFETMFIECSLGTNL